MTTNNVVYIILFIIGIGLLGDSFLVVKQKTAVIIERFGRLHSIRFSGLSFKLPIVDRLAAKQNLKIQQLDVDVETKTKDNVFVNAKVSVQYQIIREKVAESYYKLENPKIQIESYVFDVVRSEIPKLILDEVFSNKNVVAESIKHALTDSMEGFGYTIRNSLITDLQPESSVKEAMNRINATEREKDAARNEADAQKIKLVRIAEADAESKRLQGEGLANQRKEIAKGIRESIETIKECGVDEEEVMTLLLVTQHYDAIQDVAKNSVTNTVMLNYSPSGISDVATQIREAVLSVKTHKNVTSNEPGRPLLNVG
jgi:regulator of protease activity HflC (stomatin/prohibitin superfamily)